MGGPGSSENYLEGKCLPKDLTQLINSFRDNSLNPRLFEAVREYNKIPASRRE